MLLTLLSPQAAPPTPQAGGVTFLWIKDNGTWRRTTVYFNKMGTYAYSRPYIKVSGTWK
jgi:hypothetical protein